MSQPICTIIAGPNGAGKTTFALKYLAEESGARNFVNADLISAGLSPLSPDRELYMAGRLFLKEIRRYVRRRESFAFETTLSGMTHLKFIQSLIADGWIVQLIYLWVPSVETSLARVAERVTHGGHDVPQDVIIRRYPRSIRNLLERYSPVCTWVVCLDNSQRNPEVIFTQNADGRIVENPGLFEALQIGAKS